jgi:hypothetical protein
VLDLSFLAPNTTLDYWQVIGTHANQAIIHQWVKPRNASMIMMLVMSSGGGGGGGFTAAAGSAKGGGSGGAVGAFNWYVYPAYAIPDVLFCSVPRGGTGGLAGADGIVGNVTYVYAGSMDRSGGALDVVGYGGPGGGPGAHGTATTATTGASGGSTGSTLLMFNGTSVWQQLQGLAAYAGGGGGLATTNNDGASLAIPNGASFYLPSTGGGAANTGNSKGGVLTATAGDWRGDRLPIQSAAAGPGQDGYWLRGPSNLFLLVSGQGGGGNNGGVGGKGGDATSVPGAGGGGGGAGTTGGAGGDGGPGMVAIITT